MSRSGQSKVEVTSSGQQHHSQAMAASSDTVSSLSRYVDILISTISIMYLYYLYYLQVDVIILGAGLTGLCVARQLARHKKRPSFVVLEARDRVGRYSVDIL